LRGVQLNDEAIFLFIPVGSPNPTENPHLFLNQKHYQFDG
jgi:hypothetical protein